MNLDELKHIWQENDQELDQSLSVNQQLLKEVSLNRVHAHLRTFKFEKIFEMAANGFFALWLGNFLLNTPFSWGFSSPALFLFLVAVADLAWNTFLLSETAKISFGAPILEAQRTLERITLYNRREINLLYVLIPLFPVALFIVVGKSWLGLDLYDLFGSWMLWFMGGSLVIAAIIVWFLKRFPDQQMQKALDFLQEISQFEREDS